MARLYSNENFPRPVVEALRHRGHDVLTSLEAGRANQGIPDDEVLMGMKDIEKHLWCVAQYAGASKEDI